LRCGQFDRSGGNAGIDVGARRQHRRLSAAGRRERLHLNGGPDLHDVVIVIVVVGRRHGAGHRIIGPGRRADHDLRGCLAGKRSETEHACDDSG